MATVNNLNMIQIIKGGLEREVKNAITEELVKEELLSYEKRIRETIRPIINRVSFKGIKSIKDAMRIRGELHVFLHWNDEVVAFVEKYND